VPAAVRGDLERPPSAATSGGPRHPIPRPDTAVTFVAVENPAGRCTRSARPRSVRSCGDAPWACARARIESKSRPRRRRELDGDLVADLRTVSAISPVSDFPARCAPPGARCRGRARCASGARAGRRAFRARSGRARPGRRGSRDWRACRAPSRSGAESGTAARRGCERHRADREELLLDVAV